MNYVLGLPDEVSGGGFRGLQHRSLVMELTLPGLVSKTFKCPY